eukprot:4636755-Prorocentrum_lima.AAC.1
MEQDQPLRALECRVAAAIRQLTSIVGQGHGTTLATPIGPPTSTAHVEAQERLVVDRCQPGVA